MRLRPRFSPLQSLFAVSVLIAIGGIGTLCRAEDRIILRDNSVRVGEITKVASGTLKLKVPEGEIGIPLQSVAQIQMVAPTNFALGKTAYSAGENAKAIGLLSPIVDKYKGLPTDWASEATSMMGDLYIATNNLTKAEAAYSEFKSLYPSAAASGKAEIGMASIAVSKKDFATAHRLLDPIIAKALATKFTESSEAAAYGRAFLLLGQTQEAEGKKSEALESYLRTVTVFYQDGAATSDAKRRADLLRKDKTVVAP